VCDPEESFTVGRWTPGNSHECSDSNVPIVMLETGLTVILALTLKSSITWEQSPSVSEDLKHRGCTCIHVCTCIFRSDYRRSVYRYHSISLIMNKYGPFGSLIDALTAALEKTC
jgi:hypothetical protein